MFGIMNNNDDGLFIFMGLTVLPYIIAKYTFKGKFPIFIKSKSGETTSRVRIYLNVFFALIDYLLSPRNPFKFKKSKVLCTNCLYPNDNNAKLKRVFSRVETGKSKKSDVHYIRKGFGWGRGERFTHTYDVETKYEVFSNMYDCVNCNKPFSIEERKELF
jgi:hypothetical protein